MKQEARDEYERAKRLARDAIEAYRERAKRREPPSPDALMKAIQDKAAQGEAPTEKEAAALAAALAAANPPKRGRGRPKGSADTAAKRAFRAALVATDNCNLNAYRNAATGRRPTLCGALAEAMNEAGFASLTTYDAAAAEMKATRRSLKEAAARFRPVAQRVQAQMQGVTEALAAVGARYQSQMQGMTESLAALGARMRKAVSFKLSPETLEAMAKEIEETRKDDKTER